MTTMIREVYDALREAGVSDDKAAAAAEAVQPVREEDRLRRVEERLTRVEERLTRIESDIWWVRWIVTGGVGLYVMRSVIEWIR